MYKILIINKQFRNYDIELYKSLSREFQVFVLWINDFKKNEYPPQFILEAIDYEILLKPGNNEIVRRFKFVKLLTRILHLTWSNKYDLIITGTSGNPVVIWAYLGAKLSNTKIAIRREGWYYRYHKSFSRRILKNIKDRITFYMEKHSNAVLCPGIKQIEYLQMCIKSNNHIFKYPYLIEDISKRSFKHTILDLNNSLSFIYIGRLIPQKGLDVLIKVFNKLNYKHSSINLMVIGGKSNKLQKENSNQDPNVYYNTCINAMEINQNIIYFGEVSAKDIHNYFKKADVFVHPHVKSVGNIELYEGWGNVITEAASMGLPIISSDHLSSPYELVTDNGFIINSSKLEKELYDAMEFFILNPEKIKQYGNNSRRNFELYSNPEINYQAIYSIIESQ